MLSLKNIVKDYTVSKELVVHALKGVSMDFRESEFVAVLGASGCGKTTLLNIIGGLDRYTDGDLQIDGISTANYKEDDWNSYRNHRIGFVFQSYNLIPHQTVAENVELALTLSGVGKEERRRRAVAALTEVGLEKEINKKPNQLSGGQMQRVALARALVNNPRIVLADEPTGALDSVTSVQVMDLLKKIAETRLVIMVTHNNELAQKYSTRIIRLHDGEVISDSDPYISAPVRHEAEEQTETDKAVAAEKDAGTDNETSQSAAQGKPKQKRAKKQKVGMKFTTALSLSFKNLLTKKGRTVMTSFAGSIGIIGVALVLALSNGFNIYIAKLQSDTLSGYPITISTAGADFDAMYEQLQSGSGAVLEKFPENDNNIHIYDNSTSGMMAMIHMNYIDQNYYDYIENFYREDLAKRENDRLLNGVQYSYMKTLNIVTRNADKYVCLNTAASSDDNSMMSMFMGGDSVFQEALGNSEFVTSQYDVLEGKYPTEPNEIAVIVDSRNRISVKTLDALGIEYNVTSEEGVKNFSDIPFDEILEKTFKMVYNDAYFIEQNGGAYYITAADIADEAEQQTKLAQIYEDEQNTYTLNIVGILRINEEAPLSLYDAGILYLPSLTEKYIENSKTSAIAEAQNESRVYLDMSKMDAPLKRTGYYAVTLSNVKQLLEAVGYKNVDDNHAMQYVLQQFGASDLPTAIYLYPKDFNSKDRITAYLNEWNNTEQGKVNKIVYTDATAILSNSMGQMVNIISYVLIAFASISLVVSSVMIGIITYVSVIERTKEIGVLRSIGASKNDVSNVFNAESFLIGLAAGLIGVILTYILCIPVNAILLSVAGGALTTNLAVLNPLAAIALIAISCLLTLIAGSIPSRVAAKLDPVKALRTE